MMSQKSRFRFRFASVLAVIALSPRLVAAQNSAADLVLIHGHILTVDAKDSVAQAVAIRQV